MSKSEDIDHKERFRTALEKKKLKTSKSSDKNDVGEGAKLRAASGNKPKMFRRKSG